MLSMHFNDKCCSLFVGLLVVARHAVEKFLADVFGAFRERANEFIAVHLEHAQADHLHSPNSRKIQVKQVFGSKLSCSVNRTCEYTYRIYQIYCIIFLDKILEICLYSTRMFKRELKIPIVI